MCPSSVKSSHSNFELQSPDCYWVRSYLITTVLLGSGLKGCNIFFFDTFNPSFAVKKVIQLGIQKIIATKYYLDTNFKVLYYLHLLQFYLLSNFQHVVIVNNEIHSSSCVLHYYECSRNHALSSSQLELFFHLVQVKNKSFIGLVLP